MNDLSCGIKCGQTFFRFITNHAFNRQTGRQTDRKALAIPCVVLHAIARQKRNIKLLQSLLTISVYFKNEIISLSVSQPQTDVFSTIVLMCSRRNLAKIYMLFYSVFKFKNRCKYKKRYKRKHVTKKN